MLRLVTRREDFRFGPCAITVSSNGGILKSSSQSARTSTVDGDESLRKNRARSSPQKKTVPPPTRMMARSKTAFLALGPGVTSLRFCALGLATPNPFRHALRSSPGHGPDGILRSLRHVVDGVLGHGRLLGRDVSS